MRLSDGRQFSYCLNVHKGESLEEAVWAIGQHVPHIRRNLCPDAPFGLGLRLSRHASDELKLPDALPRFRDLLAEQNLYAFTVNGFPYGAFHQTRVKENVYLPDWTHPDRLEYTLDLFDHLAALLPRGLEGSVSTAPLGYKRRPGAPRVATADEKREPPTSNFIENLTAVARRLARLESETGKFMHLGLEPEPDCILETTGETIAFFEELFRRSDLDETLLRRHLGVCFDTCHVAMRFEDPAESLRRYRAAGVRISKTQISAALECAADTPIDRLRPFDDGVYLHQVKSSTGAARPDLPDWLDAPDPKAGTIRIHAHVPLHWPGDDELRSTRHTLAPDFWRELEESGCPHLEVETYTFDVLPEDLRQGRNVDEDMVQECRWALEQL